MDIVTIALGVLLGLILFCLLPYLVVGAYVLFWGLLAVAFVGGLLMVAINGAVTSEGDVALAVGLVGFVVGWPVVEACWEMYAQNKAWKKWEKEMSNKDEKEMSNGERVLYRILRTLH